MKLAWLAATLAAGASTVAAAAGLDTALGRAVLPRAGAPAMAVATSPRGHYVLHCAGCHRTDGSGVPAAYVPDLRRIGDFLRVPGGREFVISVPGVMGSGLDDRQVAEVTNWLMATVAAASVPAGHRPYDAAEVARARASAPVDVAGARRRLVEQGRSLGLAID